jgi:hypothetical protein
MPSNLVVFDIESDSLFSDYSSIEQAYQFMQPTCVCANVYLHADVVTHGGDAPAKEYVFWRDSSDDPFSQLLQLFDDASSVVAYNGLGFDFNVMRKFYRGDMNRYFFHRSKCVDACTNLHAVVGQRFKLDSLLRANGLTTKSASGLDAVRWWREGKRTLIETYCSADTSCLFRLSCVKDLRLPGLFFTVPNRAFGVLWLCSDGTFTPATRRFQEAAGDDEAKEAKAQEKTQR